MSHYKQSLVIEANPDAVYAALTTAEGLSAWWSQDCDIAVVVGGTHQFRFGPHHKSLRIEALVPGRDVRWLCTLAKIDVDSFARKDEWVGTQIVFRLTAQGTEQTRVDFEHIGLVPALACYDMCVDGWQHFLESLRLYVETGRGTPFELAAHTECSASRAAGAVQASA